MTRIVIKGIHYYRNGINSNGFFMIHFDDKDYPTYHFMGIVFQGKGDVAVFLENNTAPGWKGDYYESWLREAIETKGGW